MDSISKFTDEYRWLSNFWPAVVTLDGIEYPSVEHAYQAAKSLDPVVRETIRNANTAGKAKRLGARIGRGMELEIRRDWDDVKRSVMRELLAQKFEHPELKALLVATQSREIVEGNTWHDVFWGVCTCEAHRGMGMNHLGLLLMGIRDLLK